MKLLLKPNVRLYDLSPQMVIAVLVFIGVVEKLVDEIMITSANDSTHGANSLHYSGSALDFRTHNILNTLSTSQRVYELQVIRNGLQTALPGYDVVLESVNTPNEHIHIEWDPKWKRIEPASQTVA